MTEDDVRQVARLMGMGGCDNSAIASAVSRCAHAAAMSEMRDAVAHAPRVQARRQEIVDSLRAEGWFE